MNSKIFYGALIGAVGMIASSCTIKESDEPEVGSGRLESISSMTIPFLGITYDNSGRVTQISDAIMATKITVNYSANRLEWLEYNSDDGETTYIDYKTVWNNFETNSNGYITAANAVETDYERNGSIRQEYAYRVLFQYNANGNLTRFTIVDNEYGDEITNYEWRDGLLLETSYDDGNVTYGYNNAPNNYNRQWVPWWGDPAQLALTGLLGVAPVKLISSARVNENYGYSETNYFYYNLTDAGYIASMKISGYDFDGMVFNFSYANTKSPEFFEFSNTSFNAQKNRFFHKKNRN